jgi:hypothetical protein
MTDHPSTFRGGTTGGEGAIEWEDRATIQRRETSQGLLADASAAHRGTMAQMVALMAAMPEDIRADYVIEKAGDRQFEPAEIMELAARPDFPG